MDNALLTALILSTVVPATVVGAIALAIGWLLKGDERAGTRAVLTWTTITIGLVYAIWVHGSFPLPDKAPYPFPNQLVFLAPLLLAPVALAQCLKVGRIAYWPALVVIVAVSWWFSFPWLDAKGDSGMGWYLGTLAAVLAFVALAEFAARGEQWVAALFWIGVTNAAAALVFSFNAAFPAQGAGAIAAVTTGAIIGGWLSGNRFLLRGWTAIPAVAVATLIMNQRTRLVVYDAPDAVHALYWWAPLIFLLAPLALLLVPLLWRTRAGLITGFLAWGVLMTAGVGLGLTAYAWPEPEDESSGQAEWDYSNY